MKYTGFLILLIVVFASCQSENQQETNADEQVISAVTTEAEFFSPDGRMVTPESYPKDETSRQFLKAQDQGGINKFNHKRVLTSTENQPVVRMNRDTYYSMALVDVSKGATVTMPEIPEGKYMSVQPVTEDHRIQKMMYGPGTFELSTHIGNHIYLIIRLDVTFTEDEVKTIQDQMIIEANSKEMFVAEPVNKESFYQVENALKAKLPGIAQRDGLDAMVGMFTDFRDESNQDFNEEKYQVGAAIGWGGAQKVDNIYEASRHFPTDSCYELTFEDPGNEAFWSITVYDEKGFMFNDLANYSSNTATANEDGTFTISFGCGKDAPNNLEIDNPSGVFNIIARHYQPSKRVMEDGYRLVPLMTKKGEE